MIASNTKLFTGTMLATLASRGKLSLNDPVQKFFPWYNLYDSIDGSIVTVRDMLSHRIGTKTFQGDFTFWNSTLTSEQIMRKMRLLKPSGIFRQDFGYCNSCFLTAGMIGAQVAGMDWEKYIQDSLLVPLEMTESVPVSRGCATLENIATPYTTSFTGHLAKVPYDEWDNLGPAASIISTVKDLSHWLECQLNNGTYQNKQVIPASAVMMTRDMNSIVSSRPSSMLPMHFRGYGLGVFEGDYNGKQIFWHTGGAAGMVSNVCFVPEEKLGIAILTNNDNQSFFEALRYQLLNAYLGGDYHNFSELFLSGFRSGMKEQLAEIDSMKSRAANGKPDLPLGEYAGTYNNQLYGSLSITPADGKLHVRFNTHAHLTATLSPMDHGEWLLAYENIEYGIFPVKFTVEGKSVRSLLVRMNDFVEMDPYMFTRQ